MIRPRYPKYRLERLARVNPETLLGYLEARGWRYLCREEDRAEWWAYGEEDPGPGAMIFVPLHSRFADYALRIGEAMEVLEAMEDRPGQIILWDVLTEDVG